MLDRISDWWVPNIALDEYTKAAPRPVHRGTSRPSDWGEDVDPEDYERLTARDHRDPLMSKTCRECGAAGVYARGWCRKCYQRWHYRQNHSNIRAAQKKYKDRIRKEKQQ